MDPMNILVVDDEQSICLLLHDVLTRFGHTVETRQDGAKAVELAAEQRFDLVFLDIRMPGMNGVDTLKALRQVQPAATFVMITGYAHDDIVDECLNTGAADCLCKPFSLTQVTEMMKKLSAEAAAT